MSAPRPDAVPVHAAVVLAAGASRRLGAPKQLLVVAGETLLHRAARIALSTAPLSTLVVLGAQADAMRAALADLDVGCIDCPDWRSGQSAALRAGVAALQADLAIDGVLVLLCDQPDLDSAHAQALLQAWHAEPARAVASRYDGVAGVPALLPRRWFADLLRIEGDRGARELLRQRAGEVTLVDAPALARDVDTPAQARGMTRQSSPE